MKNFLRCFLLCVAFFSMSNSLKAQAKIINVWDQGQLSRVAEGEKLQSSPLAEGMLLQANDSIEIPEDHILQLLLDDGTKIYLEGPKKYSVPKMAWDAVGYLSFEGKKENFSCGMSLKKGSELVLSEGYQLFLSNSENKIKQFSGPLQYKIKSSDYCVEGYQKSSTASILLEYSSSNQEVLNLGSIQTVRGPPYEQNFQSYPYPLLPRGTLKSSQNIQFRWTPIISEQGEPKDCFYVLTVMDSSQNVLFTKQTKDTFYQIPSFDFVPQHNYFWSVSLPEEKSTLKIPILILSEEDQKSLQQVEIPLQNQLAQGPKQLDVWWNLLILYYDRQLYSDAFLLLQQLSQNFGRRPKKMFPLFYKIAIDNLEMTPELLQLGFSLDIKALAQECFQQIEIAPKLKKTICLRLGLPTEK